MVNDNFLLFLIPTAPTKVYLVTHMLCMSVYSIVSTIIPSVLLRDLSRLWFLLINVLNSKKDRLLSLQNFDCPNHTHRNRNFFYNSQGTSWYNLFCFCNTGFISLQVANHYSCMDLLTFPQILEQQACHLSLHEIK